jgi:magnesium chelatase family protein
MLVKVQSATIVGLDCQKVNVEVDILSGLPAFIIVGLPDKAIEESRERIRSAILNSKAKFPRDRIIVNLAPADLPKIGPSFDLPIAVGILQATEQIPTIDENWLFLGELSLDGHLRYTNGVLPTVMMAKEKGFKKVFLPEVNSLEATLIPDIEIIPIKSLFQLIMFMKKEINILPAKRQSISDFKEQISYDVDMAEIKGQDYAKRALEIAAAGGHNVLMVGPPGAGKTLLAKAMPSILPEMTETEILEVTKIYSVAGKLPPEQPLITHRPFRSPHHTASDIALVGGGKFPKPGEITLAHRGVLFLDELPEFPRSVLEVLRQPLEDRIITISRAAGSLTFPAHFILIAAMNPCPCGFLNDSEKQCICTPTQIIRYQKKISGPLLDRIDIHIEVPKVDYDKLTDQKAGESSENIRQRVQQARNIQQKRFVNLPILNNAEMGLKEIKEFCQLNEEGANLLKIAISSFHLSARAYHRVLKLSRTIADLESSEKIKPQHVAEALAYRPKEQEY